MLDRIQVASPCSQSWDDMDGDDRARFCRLCRLNVYNLSDMTRVEAEAFVREREGSVCVRFFRRDDGTVLTRDCPVGLRLLWRGAALIWAGTAAVGTLLAGLAFGAGGHAVAAGGRPTGGRDRTARPFQAFFDLLRPDPKPMRPVVMGAVMVGRMRPPPRTPPPVPLPLSQPAPSAPPPAAADG